MFPSLVFLLVSVVGCNGISDGPGFVLPCRRDRVGINTLRTQRNGQVLIETSSREELEAIEKDRKEKCGDKLEVSVHKWRSPRLVILYYIMSCHILYYVIMSCHTLYYIMSYVMSYVILYYIMSYYVMSYIILYYVMSYYVMSYIILCHYVMSYIMLYYVILCHVMSCHILYYVILYYIMLYYITYNMPPNLWLPGDDSGFV